MKQIFYICFLILGLSLLFQGSAQAAIESSISAPCYLDMMNNKEAEVPKGTEVPKGAEGREKSKSPVLPPKASGKPNSPVLSVGPSLPSLGGVISSSMNVMGILLLLLSTVLLYFNWREKEG